MAVEDGGDLAIVMSGRRNTDERGAALNHLILIKSCFMLREADADQRADNSACRRTEPQSGQGHKKRTNRKDPTADCSGGDKSGTKSDSAADCAPCCDTLQKLERLHELEMARPFHRSRSR